MAQAKDSTMYRLSRDEYHLYFDPQEPPRLTVPPGSRILVETEDALFGTVQAETDGYSSLSDILEKLGGGNPVTGPIYIEGVEPGDCIATTIEHITPGPVTGNGWTGMTPGLGGLQSQYSLEPNLPRVTRICPIKDGIISLPTAKGVIEIPTAPFVGAIGVAPRGERRLSVWQGAEFLGNCDLPLNGPGATIVIRANVPGGLLSLGDVHAAQGDGEISGTAIECQGDVQIRVDRIPKDEAEYVDLPQVNTEQTIGSIACFNGVTVADLIRAAYIDVIRRMVSFHGFELQDAVMVATQTCRVTVGQMVDPTYCAAVTIDRKYLS